MSLWSNLPRVDCPHCAGHGYTVADKLRSTCAYCHGRGTVVHADAEVYIDVREATTRAPNRGRAVA